MLLFRRLGFSLFSLLLALLVARPVYSVSESQSLPPLNLPSDPYVAYQTEMITPELQLPIVWELIHGAPQVVVAVIDTGVDLDHEDLRDNFWVNSGEIPDNDMDDDGNGYIDDVHGFDFYDNDSSPMDERGHGTHIAGIIGAVGNNGLGVTGVAWDVQMMVLKFTGGDGLGRIDTAIEAIRYAIDNGAHIINSSWVIKSPSTTTQQSLTELKKTIEEASQAGILFVTGAGNGDENKKGYDIDQTPVYPASLKLDNMMTVAALGGDGSLANYSNFGSQTVDLAAPGNAILSTLPGNHYGYYSGTSMATAFVSGTAALMMSRNSEWTALQVKDVILNYATHQGSLEGKVLSKGSLNIMQSLNGETTLAGINLDEEAQEVSLEGAESPEQVGAEDPAVSQDSSNALSGCSLHTAQWDTSSFPFAFILLILPLLGLLAIRGRHFPRNL